MPYKPRILEKLVLKAAEEYPVVTITGPRQSGKTMLCRTMFPRKPYVSLEPLDQREFARVDPRGFLSEYPEGGGSEIYKHRVHRGEHAGIYHFRQSRGLEIDLILQVSQDLIACEVKSAATIDRSFFRPLQQFDILLERMAGRPKVIKRLVFGGDNPQQRTEADCIGWQTLHGQRWLP